MKLMVEITHEREKCIGCGACASICPQYWDMNDDGKSTLKGGVGAEGEKYELELEDAGCNQEAADACPVQCIIVSQQ